MYKIEAIPADFWRQDLPAFKEKTAAFYAGALNRVEYKGFSGYYGSYAQRDGQSSMLRLRMPTGRVTRERLLFAAAAVRRYKVPRLHFTTCQTIQLHDLDERSVCGIMEEALDAGIVTLGGGGDFPRNVMCPPLSGVEEEFFDVLPWAEAASGYLLHFIKAEKLPRKLKVGFANSLRNQTHATFRDLGFLARPDGRFDVYSAGGLGNCPRLGVKMAEAVPPAEILYYIKAMWLTFRAHGNYKNRGKARTRYMQESLGGAENYLAAFQEQLAQVQKEDLTVSAAAVPQALGKQADGSAAHPRALAQKQPGLYAVHWHPVGGQPEPERFCALADYLAGVEGAELRLSPDASAYIINLTGTEAQEVLRLTEDSAATPLAASVACIGSSICQQGVRDSQALLRRILAAAREAALPPTALPQLHISGCPSSCGTHQIGALGFRGAAKLIDKKPQPAFMFCINGCERAGSERLAQEVGIMLESDIPLFLTEVGRAVAASGLSYEKWHERWPEKLTELAQKYL